MQFEIQEGESDTLEFKKSLSEWKEIIETISAFSNTKWRDYRGSNWQKNSRRFG
ncbi:MAG: helix-turn-helix domain-containing protein [Methanosarcinales archaeon]